MSSPAAFPLISLQLRLQLPSRSNTAFMFDPLLQDRANDKKGKRGRRRNDEKDTSGRKQERVEGDAESVEAGGMSGGVSVQKTMRKV